MLKSRAGLALALLAVACSPEPRTQGDVTPIAERIFIGDHILTMDATVAEAVAVADGKILAIGSISEIEAFKGTDTTVTELGKRALLPGFIDAHGHFPGVVRTRDSSLPNHVRLHDLNSPPIGEMRSIDDIVEKLSRVAATLPDGEWINSRGYDDTLLAEKRHLNRQDLDRVSTKHPILARHISGHLAVANSLALQLAGISAETPDPEGGFFHRDPETGEPTGLMESSAAFGRVSDLIPPISGDDPKTLAEAGSRHYASRGVTTAQSGGTFLRNLMPLYQASLEGRVAIRLELWPVGREIVAALDADENFKLPPSTPMVHWGAVKEWSDGSIQGYTGFLRKPYFVQRERDDGTWRGRPRWPGDRLHEMVTRVYDAGYQIALHANGDAAIDDVLAIFEACLDTRADDDPRFIVIHSQMATEAQLDRMKTLGAIPSFFGLHVYYWGDRHRDIFMGPARAEGISPAGSAVEHDLTFTLHADTPVVPMDPLLIVETAVTRRTSSGDILGPSQRIGVEAALAAITIDAAYQHRQEKVMGSITPGKYADLVILDADPRTVAPQDIAEISVLETIVGGETVFSAAAP